MEKMTEPQVSYYTWHPHYEAREVAQHLSYNVGVALCYIWRAGRKPGNPPLQDYSKALDHIRFARDCGVFSGYSFSTENKPKILDPFKPELEDILLHLLQFETYGYKGELLFAENLLEYHLLVIKGALELKQELEK